MKLEHEFGQLSDWPTDRNDHANESATQQRLDLTIKALCIIADQMGELVMQMRIKNGNKGP